MDKCDICKENPWRREVLGTLGDGGIVVLSVCGADNCESRHLFASPEYFSLDNSIVGKV
jgi:hypothetical protein